MIPKDIEQRIIDTAKIEVIIAESIRLRKVNSNYIGICPFHEEHTESFTVSPTKGEHGIYKCFGCGRGGNAVTFVMNFERVTYPEALRIVGKRYNIEIPEKEMSEQELSAYKLREAALNLLKKQQESFVDLLSKNEKAMAWLTQERGILPATIEKWGIGYAASGFFAGRLTYPIRHVGGEIYGFTGRRLKEEIQPKFKNSADSDLFKKSELLFGLSYAKRQITKANKAYLVEGQHDVLMMDQIGLSNTVAPSGTAITIEQIRAIKRFTNNIVLFLDGDKPGLKAAARNIAAFLVEQVNLKVIVLPEGEDPDSFIRKQEEEGLLLRRLTDRNDKEGEEETGLKPVCTIGARQYIENSEVDFIVFKAGQLKDEIENDPPQKGALLNEITNDISVINDKNVRLAYIQQCSKILGIKENELTKDIQGLRNKMEGKPEEGKWFAFDEAAESIKELKQVNVLSDFENVVENHLKEIKNCIGMNCAPMQKNEILRLKKIAKTVIFDEFVVDGFDKNYKQETPTVRSLKRLISFGFDVRMRDGIALRYHKETMEPLEISYINFTDWYINKIADLLSAADDVFTKYAIEQIAELLSYLPESTRMTKFSNVKDTFKDKNVKLIIGDFKKVMASFMKNNAKTFEPDVEEEIKGDNQLELNPEQFRDYKRYSHYFKDNAIHCAKGGQIVKISNFTIKPIIHSNTSSGHFKLFEMQNEHGLKVNISLDTKDLNDVRRFKCACEEKGNFVFKGAQIELDNIKERLYCNTTYSSEIEQLGWQSEGFWAWADGVTTTNGEFTKTDENGLITVGDKNYFIKAFSNLYAHDKTVFLNEKKFLHLTSDVTFKDWSSQYMNVFGNNSMIAICTLLTGFYSDAIFRLVHGELPILNIFGPKGTGKTQLAESLLSFFGEKQPINNLSKVTIYGLSQTLKSFQNSFCLIDEYKNSLDMRFIEMLKSIYNRQAKIQGGMSQTGSKTEHIPINQMALLCGQDLPTLDVALLERCICLTAFKSVYTNEQKDQYNLLKNTEDKGLAHLTDDFIKYRELVLSKFAETNNLLQGLVSGRCPQVSVRLQKNLTTILTSFHILQDKFEFPFTFDQVLDFGIGVIEEQQKFIESSDDLRNFWTIFATLIEQHKIKEGRNYILADVSQMRYVGNDEMLVYPKGMMCLFLRWDGLYPQYAEYSRRSNMVSLGEKTIQFYLEKTSYYQGKIAAKRFVDKETKETWNHQAWCFDYSKMDVNLIESQSIESDNKDMKANEKNPTMRRLIEQDIVEKNLKQELDDFNKAKDDLPF